MNRKQTSGFTLIELMITLAIGAILLTVAVPSFSSFIKNSRLSGEINTLSTDLAFARSEAIKRGVTTSLIPTIPGNWNSGWSIFQANDLVNPLRSAGALNGSSSLSTVAANVQYQPTGFIGGGAVVTFNLCDDRSGPHGKTLVISLTGRPALQSGISCS